MTDTSKPIFMVDAYADPVLVRIDGRASFMNSGSLKDFFAEMIRQGKTRFVVDFAHCTSMDSTFLGVLAGAALELRKLNPPGTLTLARVGERNLELIRNLGLHRLAIVDAGNFAMEFSGGAQALTDKARSEIESARLVLEAHENLVTTDSANAAKFQDVLAFLRNRVESR
ncbi:MAG TPA: STAS domain-containing protein [Candidatus Didemnitutus sp.]|nr:STAS domain-containing protein [Candidatus Didemnitutus sp.]